MDVFDRWGNWAGRIPSDYSGWGYLLLIGLMGLIYLIYLFFLLIVKGFEALAKKDWKRAILYLAVPVTIFAVTIASSHNAGVARAQWQEQQAQEEAIQATSYAYLVTREANNAQATQDVGSLVGAEADRIAGNLQQALTMERLSGGYAAREVSPDCIGVDKNDTYMSNICDTLVYGYYKVTSRVNYHQLILFSYERTCILTEEDRAVGTYRLNPGHTTFVYCLEKQGQDVYTTGDVCWGMNITLYGNYEYNSYRSVWNDCLKVPIT